MQILFIIGRIFFGGYFLYSGVMHFVHLSNMVGYSTMKKVPLPKVAVPLTGILLIAGGLSLILWFMPFVGTLCLIVFLVPTTFIMHAFWVMSDPAHKMQEKQSFLKNLALLGALLMFVSMF